MKQNKELENIKGETKSLIVSLFVNIFIITMETLSGIIGHSVSLVASGIHAISDLLTDAFSLVGAKLSRKKADKNHPFGYGKMENIFSMGMGLFIIGMGLVMLKDVFGQETKMPSPWLLIVILTSMTVRYLCSNYLMKSGLKYNSNLLISNAKEGKMDVVSSFFLLFVIILSQFQNKIFWLKYIDLVGGVLISILIIYVGINIIHEEASDLIGKQERNQNLVRSIRNYIQKEEKIARVENINLIKFGQTYLAIFAIYFNENISIKEADEIRTNLEKNIKEKYSTINKIILKIKYKEEQTNARTTRSRNSKKSTPSKTTK